MLLNIFMLFICLNTAWGITAIEGTPVYLEDGWDCYYDVGNVQLDPTGTEGGIDLVKDEMSFPTNSTSTDLNFGDGTVFNSITESLEASYKAIETMKNFVSSSYIGNTLDNVMMSCTLDKLQTFEDQAQCESHNYDFCDTLTYPAINPNYNGLYNQSNPVWDYMTDGLSIILFFLAIVSVFYWVTGRGHILSS